jgi:hypothetical protein
MLLYVRCSFERVGVLLIVSGECGSKVSVDVFADVCNVHAGRWWWIVVDVKVYNV